MNDELKHNDPASASATGLVTGSCPTGGHAFAVAGRFSDGMVTEGWRCVCGLTVARWKKCNLGHDHLVPESLNDASRSELVRRQPKNRNAEATIENQEARGDSIQRAGSAHPLSLMDSNEKTEMSLEWDALVNEMSLRQNLGAQGFEFSRKMFVEAYSRGYVKARDAKAQGPR